MPSKSPLEIEGFEYDWLARDADGHVALFSTAGGGYAPPEFLEDTDAHDAAIEAIIAAPPVSPARFAPRLKAGSKNTWELVAQRGLFAFDSDFHGGPYRAVAAPELALKVEALPPLVARVVERLEFPQLRFQELSLVSKESLERR